jgi:alpha-tubulin suppressor-like RCC1 family protein
VPVDVQRLTGHAVGLALGVGFSCALMADGAAKCWGASHPYGQLGNGSTEGSRFPVDVTNLRAATTLAASYHVCALTNGALACWGNGDSGELGAAGTSTVPVPISGLAPSATALAVGFQHTCAIVEGGRVQCWGLNTGRILGTTCTEQKCPTPDNVPWP